MKRRVQIGVTINLGNYENLKIDVSRDVNTMHDYQRLHYDLQDILKDFADQTQGPTQEAFNRYRNRIAISPEIIRRGNI